MSDAAARSTYEAYVERYGEDNADLPGSGAHRRGPHRRRAVGRADPGGGRGLLPFGALAGGIIAERSSALVAIILAGSVVIACGGMLFIVRPQIATLRIDRAAGTVRSRLEGSGCARPSEA